MPYAPGITYSGHLAIAQGGRDLGAGIAQGLAQRKSESQEAATLRKLMAIYDPDNKDQYGAMGLPELRASAQGVAIRKAQQEEQQRAAFAKRVGGMMQPGPGTPPTPADPEAGPDQWMSPPGGTSTGTAGFNPAAIMQAAAESGVLTPEMALKFMKEQEGVNWEDVMPREFTTPGGLRGVYGKSGQFQFDPTQFMQESPEITTEDGIKFMKNAKGGFQRVGTEKEPAQLPSTFQSKVDELEKELREADSNLALGDEEIAQRFPAYKKPEQIAAFKQRQQAARDAAVQNAQSLFKRYQSEGYGKPETWEQLHQTFGLKRESGKRESGKAETKTESGSDERVTVQKDGRKFTVPISQLEEAKKQGYTEVN